MTAMAQAGSQEPVVLVHDLTDPPGGRSWLLVAQSVDGLRRAAGATSARLTCHLVVGAPPVRVSTALASAADAWAARLPELPDQLEPWLGERLVGDLLAAAGVQVASDCELAGPADAYASDAYSAQERAATTAVLAAVDVLLPAPVVVVEEILAPGGAGRWMCWARREVHGRAPHPRPSTAAADQVTIDEAIATALHAAASRPGARGPVVARLTDPGETALAAARLEQTSVVAKPGSIVPVVLPPRPHRIADVVERQQRAAWDGTVKWGNTWTLELTRRLHDHLKLSDDFQVLTTVSGTAALRMAYEIVVPDVQPGDIAVVPSFTFAATGESLRQMGFSLRFVDVDPVTWTMDPDRLRAALADGRPRLIVVVDSLGVPAAHDVIAEIAREHGVPVVADSAPSLGSLYRGRPRGMQQAAHAYSLSFAKTVTAGGAGGALVLPADAKVAEGRNWWRSSSMGEVHAVFALDQLDRVEDLVARRQVVAELYDEVIADHGITRQQVAPGDRHSWVHYVIQLPTCSDRDRVSTGLDAHGVQTKPYYAPVLHDPSWGDTFGADAHGQEPDSLAVTQVLAETTLALPMSSELRACDIEQVTTALDRVLQGV